MEPIAIFVWAFYNHCHGHIWKVLPPILVPYTYINLTPRLALGIMGVGLYRNS
jgi:hypothetical protein